MTRRSLVVTVCVAALAWLLLSSVRQARSPSARSSSRASAS